jgi:hypothetical protein
MTQSQPLAILCGRRWRDVILFKILGQSKGEPFLNFRGCGFGFQLAARAGCAYSYLVTIPNARLAETPVGVQALAESLKSYRHAKETNIRGRSWGWWAGASWGGFGA